MLTGEVVPTKGDSFIVSHNVLTNFSEARKQIGYCPQFDAIFGLMTVREHLEFYAMIKKIPTRLVKDLIKKQIKDMNLEQYEDKNAGTLSGGNKRKLSVAMSMIGNPPVVFLDEPSAGMDPKARRFMWEIIAKISTRGKNSAVILTTHSMEEAEALSTSMGIMVDGQFKCFGSKQQIKNKFGTGYQVEIKFRDMKNVAVDEKIIALDIQNYLRDNCPASYKIAQIKGEEVIMLNKEACILVLDKVLESNKALEEFHEEGFGNEIIIQLEKHEYYPIASLIKWEYVMRNNLEAITTLVNEFGQATLLEQYSPRYRYRVPKGDKSVGYFFGLMEKIKVKLDVDEYSASQTTLEQVFNGFARSTGVEVVKREFRDENMAGNESEPKVYDPSLNKSELSDEEEE
jgi:ATP-binding cassette subfamily A (ABC1) protein 3